MMKARDSGPVGTLAADLKAALGRWPLPPVESEKDLDQRVRDFIRAEVLRRIIPAPDAKKARKEIKRWVAGHGEPKPDDRYWSESKPYQNVCLWGARKTADLFVYHPEGRYGLPARGISFEVKYVGAGVSLAGAIAMVAGQLLTYSLRHEHTIGFVLGARVPRPREIRSEADKDRQEALRRALPGNATLIVRFQEEPKLKADEA